MSTTVGAPTIIINVVFGAIIICFTVLVIALVPVIRCYIQTRDALCLEVDTGTHEQKLVALLRLQLHDQRFAFCVLAGVLLLFATVH